MKWPAVSELVAINDHFKNDQLTSQGLEKGCNTGGSRGLPHLFAADLIEVRKRISQLVQ
jgi:hypothetical protein